jgi:hypothetical protein
MATKKKPAAKSSTAKKSSGAKAGKAKAAPAKKTSSKASAASKKATISSKSAAPVAKAKTPSSKKAAPAAKSTKAKKSLEALEKVPAKFDETDLDEQVTFEEDEDEVVITKSSRKTKPRFEEASDDEPLETDAMSYVDSEAETESEGSEDALDSPDRIELEEDDLDEDTEGPPPWWKDDPTGIEAADDELGGRAQFDDSDEWSEDDEDWSSKRSSFDDVDDSGDEEDTW